MVIDMEVDMPRGHSVSLSTNGSRASSTHSYTSSMEYAEYVKAITNNTTQVDQVELSEFQGPTLFYIFPKVGETESAK